MADNPFIKTQPQSSLTTSSGNSIPKTTTSAPQTTINPYTGKPVYITTEGKVTESKEEAEKDIQRYKQEEKKKKKKKKKKSTPTTTVTTDNVFLVPEPVSEQEPITQTVKEPSTTSRVKTIKSESTQLYNYLKQPTDMSIGPFEKEKTVEELQQEKQEVESRLRKKFYTTKPVYAEYGQGTQIGTEEVLRPEVEQQGIEIPFTGGKKRLFQTKESKEYMEESQRLKDLESEIYAKTTGKTIASSIDLKQLPSDVVAPLIGMETFVPGRERTAIDISRELEKTQREKLSTAAQIPQSTGIIESGILYATSQLGIGEQAPATKVLGLSKREKELQKELTTAKVLYGTDTTGLQESLQDLATPEKLGAIDVTTIPTEPTPEQRARRSLARGAAEDVATLAVTAGIAAGATKLATTSPLAFKAVKTVDIFDDISDVYDIGSGVVNIVSGNAPGAARNIGNIVTGNIVAGGTSKKLGSRLDFTPVAETKLETKLFPVGAPVKTLGYDLDASLKPTTEPSYQEKRIAQELPLLPTKARVELVSEGPEFPEVIVETKRKKKEPREFVSAAVAPSTQAPDFGTPDIDRAGVVFETPGETVITRPSVREGILTGYITPEGKYKQVRRNIPRERLEGTFKQMLASKKASLATTRPSVLPSLRPDVSVRESIGLKLGIEPDVELKTKFTPTTSTRTKLRLLTDTTPTTLLDYKEEVKPTVKPDITPIEGVDTGIDYTPTPDVDYIARIDPTVQPDVTPTYTYTPTPTITPKFDFTPGRLQFRLPRTTSDKFGMGRRTKQFSVENKILDITKGFKRTKSMKSTGSIFNNKLKTMKGLGASEKLKRFL